MRIFKKPLLVSLPVFLFSYYIFSLFYSAGKLVLALSAGAVFLAFLILYVSGKAKKAGEVAIILTLPLIISSLLSFFAFDIHLAGLYEKLEGEEREVSLVIIEKEAGYSYSSRYCAYLLCADGGDVGCRVKLYTGFYSDYETGQVINTTAAISRTESGIGFSERYTLAKGYPLGLEISDPESVVTDGERFVFPYTQIALLRQRLSLTLTGLIEDREALSLAKALTYGESDTALQGVKSDFSALGISHLLAISGLHLGILMASAGFILRKFGAGKTLCSVLCLIFGFGFLFITGFRPSIFRAYLTFALLILSEFSKRARDGVITLLFAVSFICVISPYSICDVGLHLSFFATLGILTVALPAFDKLRDVLKFKPAFYIVSLEIASLSAILFTLPYSLFVFHGLSLLSPLTNLIFIPLFTLLVYLLPPLILSGFIPFIALPFVFAYEALAKSTLQLSSGISGTAGGLFIDLSGKLLFVCGSVALISSLLCLVFFRKKRIALLPVFCFLALAVTVNMTALGSGSGGFELSGITEKGSDALLIKASGKTALIDNSAGGYSFLSSCFDCAESDSSGRTGMLMITHYHSAMPSSLDRLTSKQNIENLVLFIPKEGDRDSEGILDSLLALAEERGIDCVLVGDRGSVSFEGTVITLCRIENAGSHDLISVTVLPPDGSPGVTYVSSGTPGDALSALPLRGISSLIIGSHGKKSDNVYDPGDGIKISSIENTVIIHNNS